MISFGSERNTNGNGLSVKGNGQFDYTLSEVLEKASDLADEFSRGAGAVDYEGGFPRAEFQRIRETGLLEVALGHKWGGLGLGIEPGRTLPLLRLLKQIGRGNLAVGRVYEGHINGLLLVQTFGTPAQIERYVNDTRAGQVFGVWNAEGSDGVKLIPLEDGRYRLEGSKTFASGAGYVSRPFANGALPDGSWQMCIVPMEKVRTTIDPDWWQPLGMRASASYRVDFSGVELDATDLLGKPGDYLREPWLHAGAIRFCAVQLGGAEALYDAARVYVRETGRTDDPYQRMRLGQLATAIESGNLWIQGAAEITDRFGQPGPNASSAEQCVIYTYMMRTAIEDICLKVMELVERTVGARGFIRPQPFERMFRDLTHYLRQPAPDAALASVGQHVLTTPEVAGKLWSNERR